MAKRVEPAKHTKYIAGRCYNNAYTWAVIHHREYDSVQVVHGFPIWNAGPDKGKLMGHAWVERDGWCYDPFLDKKWPKAFFYEAGNINPDDCRYYTLEEAMAMHRSTGHCGPWHDGPPNALFKSRKRQSGARKPKE